MNPQNPPALQFGDVIMDDLEVAEEMANINLNRELIKLTFGFMKI